MSVPVTKSVPPNGGWGWMVCFAYALSNVVVIPILQSFGLLFRSKFESIGLSATDIAIIINTNSAFGMLMGLVNGSLLNKYGYRKCAIAASLLTSGGVILTAFADGFYFFFFTYGIITSLGFGLTMASGSLALNSFFTSKRSRAMGYAMTGTGLGPIFLPLLISFLLDFYGTTGCVLIIGAISMHSTVAACLMQPLKWHMKTEVIDQEMTEIKNNDMTEKLIQKDNPDGNTLAGAGQTKLNSSLHKFEFIDSTLSIDHDVETKSIYGFETPLLSRRRTSQSSFIVDSGKHRKRAYGRSISAVEKSTWQSSYSVYSQISLKSINEENKPTDELPIELPTKLNEVSEEKKPSFGSRLVKLFDLALLKDPIYLNLMLGMSLAICAEINFSLLTPFILNDFNFNRNEVARIMSLIAATDIVFRFCAPFIGDWLKLSAKPMYMVSLIMLILCRTALIYVQSFMAMCGVGAFLGIAKGFRTVYMSLLIPSYVPIERLAAASGIQMVANGIITMIGGPILGVIRDLSGNYTKCIMVINGITFLTILMWTIEYLYRRYFTKKT